MNSTITLNDDHDIIYKDHQYSTTHERCRSKDVKLRLEAHELRPGVFCQLHKLRLDCLAQLRMSSYQLTL